MPFPNALAIFKLNLFENFDQSKISLKTLKKVYWKEYILVQLK